MLPISRCNSAGFRLILGLALLLISWQSLTPDPVPAAEVISDKLLHVLAFVVLGFLADAGWPDRPFDWRKYAPLALYGVLIEGTQSLIPGRQASLADLAADAVGLTVYGTIAWIIARRLATQADEVE